MKLTYSAMIAAMLFCITISCNKKNESDNKKSVEALFKGNAWSGDLKYSAHWTEQPFYVQFNSSDNHFNWTEASGTFGGSYATDEAKRQFTMTFNSGSMVTLTIDNNEKVSGISYGGSYGWTLSNVEPNSSANDVIENTTWKGIESQQFGPSDNNSTLSFKPGSLSFSSATGVIYSRSASVVKFTINVVFDNNFFLVVNKNKIKGVRLTTTSSNPFTRIELTKQ